MTTWETLLFGLEKQVRRYGFDLGDAADMSSVLREEIRDYRDLEQLIDYLPSELESAGENDFGDAYHVAGCIEGLDTGGAHHIGIAGALSGD